jgi:hypothetical protein
MGTGTEFGKFPHLPGDINDRSTKFSEFPEEIAVSHRFAQRGGRVPVRIGAPDPSLTPVSGMAVVTELCGRLGIIKALDTAVARSTPSGGRWRWEWRARLRGCSTNCLRGGGLG